MTADRFAAAIRDEIWIAGALIESRFSYGTATQNGREIVAVDSPDPELLAACDAELQRVHDIVAQIPASRLRVIVRATSDEAVQSTITVAIDDVSIVTTADDAIADAALLRTLLSRPPTRDQRPAIPLVWRNGSAAVLLHEAVGHAAEHRHAPLSWPRWLGVHDGTSDLLAGEPPRSLRRETFRDVPLPRMTDVVVTQRDAPFDLPPQYVEVHLVGAGSYEPLTEAVTVNVAIADFDGRRLPPFDLRIPRARVAASLLGATGDPIRYPGVICSREGQQLFVRSSAPLMITTELA